MPDCPVFFVPFLFTSLMFFFVLLKQAKIIMHVHFARLEEKQTI